MATHNKMLFYLVLFAEGLKKEEIKKVISFDK
jgi:hypothetical protein